MWDDIENGTQGLLGHFITLARAQHDFAFPLIGAGSGGFNQDQAKKLMLDELSKLDVPMLVKIVVFRKAKT